MATWSGGKEPDFAVYLNRDLFDTPENRVITSGLTLASVAGAFLGHRPINAEEP
jgi:hypothetical protein